MREKMLHTLLVSLEWRLVAFVITNLFLWVTTGQFWKAAGLAFLLQIILFVCYLAWHFVRVELSLPLFPGIARSSKRTPDTR